MAPDPPPWELLGTTKEVLGTTGKYKELLRITRNLLGFYQDSTRITRILLGLLRITINHRNSIELLRIAPISMIFQVIHRNS